MKIHGPPNLNRLEQIQRAEKDRSASSSADGAQAGESVVLSDTAQFINGLRDTAAGMEPVRLAEVARAREDISSGAIDSDAEIAAAADGILATI